MDFLAERYLLGTEIAEDLYTEVVNLLIVDAHSHAVIEKIIKNEGWDNIWEVEGVNDRYV